MAANRSDAPKGSARRFLNLLRGLQAADEARRQAAEAAGVEPGLARLRRWQSERLARTYADLLADPEYRRACTFFLTDIYSPDDFSQRDHDAERLHDILARYLPESMLRLLADTIRLNRMSTQLDRQLLAALGDPLDDAPITPQRYAQAYRDCGNQAERRLQIELLVEVLREAALGARGPVFAVSLKLARLPARRLGWNELYDFLERGYLACRPMRAPNFFVDTIRRRELAILENIFSAASDPFSL